MKLIKLTFSMDNILAVLCKANWAYICKFRINTNRKYLVIFDPDCGAVPAQRALSRFPQMQHLLRSRFSFAIKWLRGNTAKQRRSITNWEKTLLLSLSNLYFSWISIQSEGHFHIVFVSRTPSKSGEIVIAALDAEGATSLLL